ncbi:alanine--tRNA ligase-related protein [Shigella flexneri]
MLGNFSFGDYFKHNAIQFAWELLTSEEMGLPCRRASVGYCHESDDEATKSGKKKSGSRGRIIRIGDNKGAPYASDNFWQMGDTGPCGRCTKSSMITATTVGVALRKSGRRRRPLH